MNEPIQFTPAEPRGFPFFTAIYGPASRGKTKSALLIARGLVGPQGKIVGICTEGGRMNEYGKDAAIGGFLCGEMTAPYTPERCRESIDAAIKAGADAVVFDSLTDEWSDEGGVLEQADERERGKMKGLLKWSEPKRRHKKLVRFFLRPPVHIIGCMRAKEKFREVIDGGSKKLVSDGYVPEQDRWFSFFAMVQLGLRHEGKRGVPIVDKIPEDLANIFKPEEQIGVHHGAALAAWNSGRPPGRAPAQQPAGEPDRLIADGRAAAANGRVSFTAWWNSPATKRHRAALRPHLDEFKALAASADAAAENPPDDEDVFPADRPSQEAAE